MPLGLALTRSCSQMSLPQPAYLALVSVRAGLEIVAFTPKGLHCYPGQAPGRGDRALWGCTAAQMEFEGWGGGGHKWGGHSGAWLSEHLSAHLIRRPCQPLFLALPCPALYPHQGPWGMEGGLRSHGPALYGIGGIYSEVL